MMKTCTSLLLSGVALAIAVPVGAQTPTPPGALNAPAPLIAIYREEVRPGKGAAHAANETAWAGAFAKAEVPVYWLGMTTVTGPNEAWFLEAQDSYEAFERGQQVVEAHATLRAESDAFSANESDILTRSSMIIARYRPGLSYQADVRLPDMRYMAVDVVRVKPGRIPDYSEVWRDIVAAHKTANMNEHWAVYQVETGMADGTFLFFYPHKSLAEADAAGPMHGSDAFADAMGERGRQKSREVQASVVETSARYYFRLSPAMSTLPKTWADADPFWNRPAPVVAQADRNRKK
jgi:hypothetical protein